MLSLSKSFLQAKRLFVDMHEKAIEKSLENQTNSGSCAATHWENTICDEERELYSMTLEQFGKKMMPGKYAELSRGRPVYQVHVSILEMAALITKVSIRTLLSGAKPRMLHRLAGVRWPGRWLKSFLRNTAMPSLLDSRVLTLWL